MFCYDWNSRYLLLTFWIILFKYRKTMRRFYLVLDKDTKEVYPPCELYPLKSYTDNKFKLWSSTFLEYNSINFKPQRAFVFTCMRVCLSLLSPTLTVHYTLSVCTDWRCYHILCLYTQTNWLIRTQNTWHLKNGSFCVFVFIDSE